MSAEMKNHSEGTLLLGFQKRGNKYHSEDVDDRDDIQCRHILVFMCFLGMACGITLHVNLSVSLVSMVNTTVHRHPQSSTSLHHPVCLPDELGHLASNSSVAMPRPSTGEFNWTKRQQGVLLGAFSYGYITTHLLAGRLAERFGGKHVLGTGVLGAGLLTLLTPLVARTSHELFVALRVSEGLFLGALFPSTNAIVARWIPPNERTKLCALIHTGFSIGTVIAMTSTGVLCEKFGWPSVFYIFGTAACIWWVCWMFLMYDTPRTHPRISATEREFIEKSLHVGRTTTRMATPWFSLLTSKPVWATVIGLFSTAWGAYMLLTCLPQYMNDILHVNISKNGILSGLPYVGCWLVKIVSSFLVDYLRQRNIVRTVVLRKITNTIALVAQAIFLILAGYSGCREALAAAMFIAAVSFGGLNCSIVNQLDIAPQFAGTILGIAKTLATIPGILAPLLVAELTAKENTHEQWMIVFYIAGAVYVFGATVFAIFASGEEQEWARAPTAHTPPGEDDENYVR